MIDYLSVVEIGDPIKSGQTQPFQCRLDDDNMYAVKGRSALTKGLMAEVCAGALGKAVGLPVPDFVIAEVPTALMRIHHNEEARRNLGAGYAFASLWQDAAEPLTPTLRNRTDPQLLATVYAFDHWIANGDRSLGEDAGNPNLMFNLSSEKLIVFDHNLAFSASYEEWELMFHAGSEAWKQCGASPDFRRDLSEKLMYGLSRFSSIVEALPDEWVEDEPDFPAFMAGCLNRLNTSDFWAQLG
jgi:hypothetical protein